MSDARARWWGKFRVPEGQTGRWRVGPFALWAENLHAEWRIAHQTSDDALASELAVEIPSAAPPPETAKQARFGFRSVGEHLHLLPALADRPIVTRPYQPFFLPAGEGVTLYITTPLWIGLALGETEPRALIELPSYVLSDTWFGPSVISGELCYSVRTRARLRLSDLPFRPHRAITALRLKNRSSEPLVLERLKLPVPYLSLFVDGQQMFWTESVSVERESVTQPLRVEVDAEPPPEASFTTRVAGPRRAEESNLLSRAFGALLG